MWFHLHMGLKTFLKRLSPWRVSILMAGCSTSISVGALVFSIMAYNAASGPVVSPPETTTLQNEVMIQPGFVTIPPHAPDFQERKYFHDEGQPQIVIPAADWDSTVGGALHVRLVNSGPRDAYVTGFSLRTSAAPSGSTFGNDTFLRPYCKPFGAEANERGSKCPSIIRPHEVFWLTMSIPIEYLSQVDPSYRAEGVVACVSTTVGAPNCAGLGVVLPDIAFTRG